MNEANIKYAIELMESASNLNMCNFQDGDADTVEELHACGNTACFIGYLCLTEVWKDFFLSIDPTCIFTRMGDVSTDRYTLIDSYALAQFLNIDESLAHLFIFGYNNDVGAFYPVPFSEVEPKHIIEKLNELLQEVGYERA